METFGGILAAIVIAILITAIFYYGFNTRGPWGSFWSFFLVLLLLIWAASLWARPVGPVYWGIAWVPLIFVGLIFALLLAATPTYDTRLPEEEGIERDATIDRTEIERGTTVDRTEIERRQEADLSAAAAIGWVFWAFIVVLFIAVIIGYAV